MKRITWFIWLILLVPALAYGQGIGVLNSEADGDPNGVYAYKVIWPNGSTSITGSVLTYTGGLASSFTVANEATDTTCFPVFVTAATGDLAPKSNAGLTFNSNTGLLGATGLVSAGAVYPSAANTLALGSATAEWSDLYLGDGAIIYGQNDQSATLTSSAATWTASAFATTNALTVGTSLVPDAADGAVIGSATAEWSDLYLADAGVIYFGADQDVTMTHVPDTGVTFNLGVTAASFTTTRNATASQALTLYEDTDLGDDYITLTATGGVGAADSATWSSSAGIDVMDFGTLIIKGLVDKISATFDGGGSAIAVNKIAYTHVPFAVTTINQWTVICDVDSGATGIIITPYMDAYAADTLPSTTMCTTGTPPHTTDGAGAGGLVHQAAWDCNITAIPADSIISFKVTTAPTSATWCTVVLKVTR